MNRATSELRARLLAVQRTAPSALALGSNGFYDCYMRWLAIACGVLTLSATGCASLESHARARAARDFHCSEDKLEVVDRLEPVFRFSGCGEVATYVCSDGADLHTRCKRATWDEHETAGIQPRAQQQALQR